MYDYIIGLDALINSGGDITITELCKKSGKSPGEFKYQYQTMANFITKFLEYKLESTLRTNISRDFSHTLYKLLEEIHGRRYYYHTVISLLNAGHFDKRIRNRTLAYRKLERILMYKIENYIKETGRVRMRDVKGCASHICSRIQVWWSQEFKDKPETIFQEIHSSLDLIERAKNDE